MSAVGDKERIGHMLDFARQAQRLTKGRKRKEFDSDEIFYLAMNRLVEVIGEAAARVTKRFRDRHTDVPWPKIIAMRNRLIHGYDSIDPDVLWEVLQNDIGPLIASLEAILNAEST